jgi:virulence-associated protein VapD
MYKITTEVLWDIMTEIIHIGLKDIQTALQPAVPRKTQGSLSIFNSTINDDNNSSAIQQVVIGQATIVHKSAFLGSNEDRDL